MFAFTFIVLIHNYVHCLLLEVIVHKLLSLSSRVVNICLIVDALRKETQKFFCSVSLYLLSRSSNLWSHCDFYVVGQHGVLREAKWCRFVPLFEHRYQLSLTNPHDALDRGKHAANKGGRSV